MGIYVSEEQVNQTEGYRLGDADVYETACDTPAEVYRALLKQHVGRCTGKVYVDEDGRQRAIGWTFVRREKYEDVGEPYLLETWVTLHSEYPTKHTEYHYMEIA